MRDEQALQLMPVISSNCFFIVTPFACYLFDIKFFVCYYYSKRYLYFKNALFR